jgi:hypothetical protein
MGSGYPWRDDESGTVPVTDPGPQPEPETTGEKK